MENINQDPNQDSEKNGDSKLMRDIPQKNKFFSSIKNLLIFLLLAVIIVASFWVSFRLGKKILVPVKKMPEQKIEAAIPEPPASIAGLQELDQITKEVKETSKVDIKPSVSKPQVSKPSVSTSTAGKYYKVQAGFFANKTNALNLENKLESFGFNSFVKRVSSGWRVQAGAYKNKSWAQSLQRALRAKGFDSVLIYE